MRKHCQRLERSLLAARGEGPDLGPLKARQKALRAEIQQLRAQIRERERNPSAALVPDDPVLASLRDSILMMSRSLSIPVNLD